MKKIGAFLLAGCLLCVGAQVLPEQNAVSITAQAITEEGNDGLRYEVYNNYVIVCGIAKGNTNTEIVIPDTFTDSEGYELPVIGVADTAFENSQLITSVSFGKNVKEIGDAAFYGCTSLKDVQLNDGLEVVELQAFQECTSLESIIFPASLKEIGGGAFREDNRLKKVEFLGGNKLIIGGCAFWENTALETVIMGEGVSKIESDAFIYCTALKEVQLSPTLTALNGFYGCAALKEITIPDSVETIGSNAFYGCAGLTEIRLPENVKSVGYSSFSKCKNLTNIQLNEGLEKLDYEAFGYTAVEELTVPSTVKSIGSQAFNISTLGKITFLGKETPIDGNFPSKCIICGYTGSTAQTFAEKNGYTFEALDAEAPTEPTAEILLGDADQNGEVDILDVISINKAILGKEALSENGLKAIDFNSNEKPDSDEAMQVLKFIVGLIENFNA